MALPTAVRDRAWPLAWFKRPDAVPKPSRSILDKPIPAPENDVPTAEIAKAMTDLGFAPAKAKQIATPTKDQLKLHARKFKRATATGGERTP